MTDAPSNPAAAFPLSWRALEARVPFDDLPGFHRAFLAWRGVEGAASLPLRRAQQRVEAELNRMTQAGQAQRAGDDWWLSQGALAGFPEAAALTCLP